jgi:hypothetical protein
VKKDDLEGVRRILVYKRTHNGDPNEAGKFGCNDCMGTVRDWDFDAVIGVGGISATAYKMEGKITWIGIRPFESEREAAARMVRRKQPHAERMVLSNGKKISTARKVTFEHFLAFRECGYFPPSKKSTPMFTNAPEAPYLKEYASTLAAKLLRKDRRAPMMLKERDIEEFKEAKKILGLAAAAPPSPATKGFSTRLKTNVVCLAKGKGARTSCRVRPA